MNPIRNPANIVITGGSRGIGRGLALEYSAPGRTIGLIARDPDTLAEAAELCRAKGATVEIGAVDVRDRAALHEWLEAFDEAHPVDLLIANAGVSAGLGPNKSKESDADAEWLAQVDYMGVIATVSGLVERMRARGRGQIALTSSIAAISPLADMPSYSGAKAGIAAYGASCRRWLKPFGVSVCVIFPGFVTSEMSSRHQGAKPFEWPLERATRHIRAKLAANRAIIAFPWQLAWLVYLQNLLPARWGDWFMKAFDADIHEDRTKR